MLCILYSLSGYFMSRLQANIIGTLHCKYIQCPKIQIFTVSKFRFTSAALLTFIYCPKCSRSSSKSGVTVFDMFIIPSTFFHCVQKSPVTICSVSEKCDQITLIYCIAKLPPQKIQGIIKSRYIA